MKPFKKDDKVRFRVIRGEHNMLAGRPGVVEGRHGRYIVVRCTEVATVFNGGRFLTPKRNLCHD